MATHPFNKDYFVEGPNEDILQMINEKYTESISLWQQFWYEGDIDTRMAAGDQSFYSYYFNTQPFRLQNQLFFNKLRRIRNMITGYQRRNRKSIISIPQHNSAQETADQFSEILIWSMNNANMFNTISEAFEGGITSGINLLSVWMDYRNDPVSGDIRCDNYSYNSFMLDPYFRKSDLSDCNFVWVRKWLSKPQAASLMPERAKEIEDLPYYANRDGKFPFQPENFQYSMKKLVAYDEFWYLDYRKVKTLIDPTTGETLEWKGNDEALQMYKRMYPNVKITHTDKQTVKVAIMINGRVFYHGPGMYGIDRYPFVPVFGYFEPEIQYFPWKMQGIVRGLRDAQYAYNRRKRIELDILESQINSGLKVKEDALVNPDDAFLTGQGRVLWLKKTAQMTDVEKEQPAQIPPSMFEASELLAKEILENSGVTEELLGMADGDKVGIVEMLRQGAGLTTLQGLFDQLDLSHKLLGEVMMEMVQQNFSIGKIQKILGKNPSKEFENQFFSKYNIQVEEGFMTNSQRKLQVAQLISLVESEILPANIAGPVILDAMTIQNKKQLIDAMQMQQQSQEQAEQAQLQAQMQEQAVVTQSLQAKAMSDQALAQERIAKVGLDAALNAERLSRSQEERDQGTLAKIKAAKELVDMDLSQLEKFINILKSIEEPKNDVEKQAENRLSKASETPRSNGLEKLHTILS